MTTYVYTRINGKLVRVRLQEHVRVLPKAIPQKFAKEARHEPRP